MINIFLLIRRKGQKYHVVIVGEDRLSKVALNYKTKGPRIRRISNRRTLDRNKDMKIYKRRRTLSLDVKQFGMLTVYRDGYNVLFCRCFGTCSCQYVSERIIAQPVIHGALSMRHRRNSHFHFCPLLYRNMLK